MLAIGAIGAHTHTKRPDDDQYLTGEGEAELNDMK